MFNRFILIIFISVSLFSCSSIDKNKHLKIQEIAQERTDKDLVIIVHGVLPVTYNLKGLGNFLEKNGFDVVIPKYESNGYTLQELTDHIYPLIASSISKTNGKVHFVGHSMGGLIIRLFLDQHRIKNLGSVILIGTPNKGSEIADLLKDLWLYKKIYGPSGQQLSSNYLNNINIMPRPYYDLGIISGNPMINPIGSLLIHKPSDGRVSVESTLVDGASDHVIVKASHSYLPMSKEVWKYVLSYIKNKKFKMN